MKKSLLALAVAAFAFGSAAQATTVYDKDGTSVAIHGRVQAILYNGDNSATGSNLNSIDSSARLGVDLRTRLTDWVSLFGYTQWEAANGEDGEGDDDFNGRYLWVGADFGQFGSIKAGKFEDALKYTIEPTDIFEDFGCVAQLGNDDRRSGQIMYEWSGFGVDFKVSYNSSANSTHVDGAYYADESLDLKHGVAASIGYTTPDVLFGPISVRAGYSGAWFQDNDESESNFNGYDDYQQWAASITWGGDVGPYASVMYSSRDFDLKTVGALTTADGRAIDDYKVQGVEVALAYNFETGVTVMGGFQWANLDMDGARTINTNAYVLNFEVDYQLAPNFKVWAEARWDLGTDDNYDVQTLGNTNYTEDCYSVGARYTF